MIRPNTLFLPSSTLCEAHSQSDKCVFHPMSPAVPRDDPAIFSYTDPITPCSESAVPDSETASSMPFSSSRVTFDALTIIVLLSFLVFALWTVAIFLFAPSLRLQFLAYRAKRKQVKKTKKQIQGLGFGYDGLSQAEFQELRRREEEDGRRSFVRLPQYPPTLSAIALLPPITIPTRPDGPSGADAKAHTNFKSDAVSDSDFDPAPIYERGDFHLQGSESEDAKSGVEV
ncbi:hypothetical protein DFH07DRAFT_496115 [Mycena maculata]|uniref:Uncharacterized protein n=1 Tax=Mycena maculata TaxID=230809 RepID=A0AAD7J1D5_9AGAR|nr:hypothetical protein DFH07DRAFT_496115 [Mycena maculata]